MNKFIAILVAIGFAQNGVVLIDEIENGLHYKIHTPMWEAISDFAIQNNVQVFATTHSQEFLEAIAPLASKNGSDYSLLRTERQNGEVQIENFSGKEFAGAVESGFEIR